MIGRAAASLACLNAATDCVDRANGIGEHLIFSSDALFLYWIIAAGWMITALGIIKDGVK